LYPLVEAFIYAQGLIDGSASCLIDISGTRGVTIQGLSLNGAKLGTNVHGIMREDADPSKNPHAHENASPD